jgi:hypothetical protein
MRKPAAVAVLLAGVLVVGGVLASGGMAGPPKRAYTPAGKALAASIALKRSDLPAGWKADTSGSSGGGEVACPGFDPDQSDLTSIGRASTFFKSGDGLATVSSVVGVFRTPAEAQSSWKRVVSPAAVACLARQFERGATSRTAKTTVVSTGKLARSLAAPRAAAYRIVADVVTNGQRVKAYVDLFFQGAGQADTLTMVTSVVYPPAVAFETRLTSALAGRLPR